MTTDSPCLLAIVEVDKSERVYCAQPGCHHTVYKAIHVVKEAGQACGMLGVYGVGDSAAATCFRATRWVLPTESACFHSVMSPGSAGGRAGAGLCRALPISSWV